MKAAQVVEYGDISGLQVRDIEKPSVADGQVLVEVYASSLNPFDSMVRSGALKDNPNLQLPFTLGGDIAGIVAKIGGGVTEFNVGDKVYGQAHAIAGNSGAFAEFAVTKAGQLAIMPSDCMFAEAAALPLISVSAVQAIYDHLKLQSGQKILIQGGGGNIGAIAVQLAKHIGAYVAATGATDDIEYIKSLGADEAIDYTTQKFEEIISKYDAVFDTAGGDIFMKSLTVLRKGGIGVSMIAAADEAYAEEHGITAISQSTHVTSDQLNKVRELVESGVIKARTDSVFPLDDVQAAFIKRETGKPNGKVVLQIKA